MEDGSRRPRSASLEGGRGGLVVTAHMLDGAERVIITHRSPYRQSTSPFDGEAAAHLLSQKRDFVDNVNTEHRGIETTSRKTIREHLRHRYSLV